MAEDLSICDLEEASYDHRVYNDEQHNFCSVPEKGFDAVLFVAIGVTFTCLAPRKHYAIVMLILGALLQLLNIEVNIRELSNALNLWIGISPAKMFFYIFLPPLLLDSAVRIDFFVFKKVMSQVFVLAFGVVAANTVLLAIFMLYVLNLRNEGWEWTDGFLFASMIASTDALAVTAIMKDGSGPESLIILAEGESLFNDATSIVFFDLFWPRFKDTIDGTLKHEPIPTVVGKMALTVLWLAFGGAMIGIAGGYITRLLFRHLQNRLGHTPVSEVGITVGMSYFCYYIAESVVGVSGVIAVVVYGLYGAATTQWDISPSARNTNVFNSFWDVTQLLTNGIVFFYAGASATNFFYRCEEDLFDGPNEDAWTTILGWLPGVYIGIFALRFLEIVVVSPIVGLFGFKIKLNEMIFIALAGLRGALALILAQELLQYEFPDEPGNDFKAERKVRAQSALWVCGFVLLTLVINAPGIPFLLSACGLETLSPLQLKYRKKSEDALTEYTQSTLEEMKTDSLAVVRGVNWKLVEDFVYGRYDPNADSGNAPKRPAFLDNGARGVVDRRWHLVESLSKPPSVPLSCGTQAPQDIKSLDTQYRVSHAQEAPFGGSYHEETALLGQQEQGQKTQPIISTGPGVDSGSATSGKTRTNGVILVNSTGANVQLLEQSSELPQQIKIYMETAQYPAKEATHKFFASQSFFNLVRRKDDVPSLWQGAGDEAGSSKPESSFKVSFRPLGTSIKSQPITDSNLTAGLLEADLSGQEDDETSSRNMMMTEARFRMLMGLKKYFQQRRTAGFLSPQGLRLLEWAAEMNAEEPEHPLHVWNLISSDIKSRFLIKLAFRVRYLLRKAAVVLKGWPAFIERLITPVLNGISRGLSVLLVGDLHIAVESAIEYWIALNVYRTHSSWLVNADVAQAMASEVREQAQMVWTFIMDREVESPDRFEAIQTFRAKRAILQSQMGFVDELFDCGLLEESEHDHLHHGLENKRAHLSRRGPVLHSFEILEFLQNIPFFANISSEVFRNLITTCQLRLYSHGDLIATEPSDRMESFSFHIIINGILRSNYTNSLGKVHEYHLGRGGIFGLLSALSGENYPWMGNGYAELNAVGHGPSVLTVPHSTLMKIHNMATKGERQYQQLELDLFRLAALYIVEYMKEEFLSAATSVYLDNGPKEEKTPTPKRRSLGNAAEVGEVGTFYVRQLDGTPFLSSSIDNLSTAENAAEVVKGSYGKSLDFLKAMKDGLLQGELVLLPPNAKFLQSSSSVLVVGSLVPQKDASPTFVAPVLMPWFVPEESASLEYRTGPQGAIVMSCPKTSGAAPGSSLAGWEVDDGMRIGANMAPMPSSAAARMHNELFQ